MTMEELVQRLVELQAEREIHKTRADTESRVLDELIKIAEEELASLQQDRTDRRRPEEFIMKSIDDQAATISAQIIDKEWLLNHILDRTSMKEVVEKYIKGFNLTAVKKYMGVHDLPIDVAEIEYKTTVKLEVEG